MHDDMRVRRAGADALRARVECKRIAVHAEQRLARLGLRLPALGARIAALEVDMAVTEEERADMALAVERDVLRIAERILRVRTHAIEGPGQILRNLPFHLAVADVAFGAEMVAVIGEIGRR